MIDAKELRIGNYIGTNTIEQVIDVNCDSFSTELHNGLPYHYADAIPLTEEWLVKLGFEQLPKTTQHHADKDANYGYPVLWLNEYTYLASNAKTPTGYLFLNNYRIDCKYVHQLQNLYFALTGEELTIATADQPQ